MTKTVCEKKLADGRLLRIIEHALRADDATPIWGERKYYKLVLYPRAQWARIFGGRVLRDACLLADVRREFDAMV